MNESQKQLPESRVRSMLKAFTWRILATFTTILIAYFFTGEIAVAISIGGVEFVLKIVIYYVHERAWQFLPRGSVRRFIHQR